MFLIVTAVCPGTTRTSRIQRTCARCLPFLWPVGQLRAAVVHNEVILTLGLHTTGPVARTLLSHGSLSWH